MELTLLDFVNKTLSALDSQSVTTASGSVESEQVAHIVNRVYDDICNMRAWPWLRVTGVNKLSLGTNAWELDLPSECMTLEYITYNSKQLTYMSPEDFAYMLMGRSGDNYNSDGIKTNEDPKYWTSYDDTTISFDAYDSSVTANLIPSLCYSQYIKGITSELLGDTDTPIIHPRFHNVMLRGVLAEAFNELAQDTGKYDRAQAEYKRGVARMVNWARRIEQTKSKIEQPDYGRNSQ